MKNFSSSPSTIEYVKPRNFKSSFEKITNVTNWIITSKEEGSFFYSTLWEYDDITKTPLELSNYRVIKEYLDFHQVGYILLKGVNNYKNIIIPVEYLERRDSVSDIIGKLKYYPVLSEYDYKEVMGSLETSYIKNYFLCDYCIRDEALFLNMPNGLVVNAYYTCINNGITGIVWHPGCKPVLNSGLVDNIISILNKSGYAINKKRIEEK
jgi:hypothetical protein